MIAEKYGQRGQQEALTLLRLLILKGFAGAMAWRLKSEVSCDAPESILGVSSGSTLSLIVRLGILNSQAQGVQRFEILRSAALRSE